MEPLAPILAVVRQARRRLWLQSIVERVGRHALLAGGSLLVIACAAKLLAYWVPLLGGRGWWFPALGGAAVLVLAASERLTRAARPSDVAVASVVDARMKLHDRLGTALAVAGRSDAFARAAVEDGVNAAADRRVAEALPRALPLRAPPGAWAGPVLAVAALCTWWFVPALAARPGDRLGGSDAVDVAEAQAAARLQVEALQQQVEVSPELGRELGDLTARLDDIAAASPDARSPEEVQRETARRMTELSKRLDDLLSGDRVQAHDALRDALSRIDPGSSPEVKALGEALKLGDGAAAQEALEQLMAQVSSSTLDEAARTKMAADLERLAQQLAEAAESNQSLRDALEASGLDGALASNEQAAEAAIEAAQSLNAEQKARLRKALKGQKAANAKLRKLAKASKSACSKCRNGGGQGEEGELVEAEDGDEADEAEEVLSAMEADAQFEEAAKGARACCNGGQCSGGGSKPAAGRSGLKAGTGATEISEGERGDGTDTVASAIEGRKKREAKSRKGVIARQLVDAPPVVGEARTRLREISGDIERGFDEGTDDDPVPPSLREAHKRYFGDLKRRIDAKSGAAASPSGSAPGTAPPAATSPQTPSP